MTTLACQPGCGDCAPHRPGAAAAVRLLTEAQAAVLTTHPSAPAVVLLGVLGLAAEVSGRHLLDVLATLPGPRPGPITQAVSQ